MRRLLLLALAIVSGAATAVAHAGLGPPRGQPYDVGFVPRATAARLLSFGHPTTMANLYWLRTVQYLGEVHASERGWDKLYPLLELVTDLDPGHGYAYQVGGNVLASVDYVRESNLILEKGIRNLPERYILPFHRAVNALLYAGDYVGAARWFEKAASTPGAPEHLREYVVSMYVKGSQAEAGVAFLDHLLASTKDDETRKAIEKQLLQARMEQAALTIDAAAARFRGRYLLGPTYAGQLVQWNFLPALPPDPYGGYWMMDDEGRAHSSVNPRRFQRPMSSEERASALNWLRLQTQEPPTP